MRHRVKLRYRFFVQVVIKTSSSKMHPYLIAVCAGVGVVVIVLLGYVAYRFYNRSSTYSKLATKSNGLAPPRIVLTPSSPGKAAKRLYSPTRTMERNREREEKLNKERKRERRKDVMSMWLPKRKDTLPITKTTIVQPMPMEIGQQNGAQRGRLTFSMHYQYKYESNISAFVVKLLNASDLPSTDSEPLDVFVKTQLIPSRKQLFISKAWTRCDVPCDVACNGEIAPCIHPCNCCTRRRRSRNEFYFSDVAGDVAPNSCTGGHTVRFPPCKKLTSQGTSHRVSEP